MEITSYDYTTQQTHNMLRTASVEAVESPNPEQRWGLNIAGYVVGVDRDGTLYSPDYHRNPMKVVGEISRSELSLDMNTSVSTAGTQLNIVGTR